MAKLPEPSQVSYVSTSVVSKALGLKPDAVRAMIDAGSLPAPQWMTLGKRVERIYSLEWVVLAAHELNLLRLPGLEEYIAPGQTLQFAIRFSQATWTVDEVSEKLNAISDLWVLCGRTVGAFDAERSGLTIRRLSAGSPLDVMLWIGEHWGLGAFGAGAIASLVLFVLKHPDKVAEALPRFVAAWHEAWAGAHEAKLHRLQAKVTLTQFERDVAPILKRLDAVPSETALVGDEVRNLETVYPTQIEAPPSLVVKELTERPGIGQSQETDRADGH